MQEALRLYAGLVNRYNDMDLWKHRESGLIMIIELLNLTF